MNRLMTDGVPSELCGKVVTPLQKKETPTTRNNIRPIVLEETLPKILFGVLAQRLESLLWAKRVLHPAQQAFRTDGSTLNCAVMAKLFQERVERDGGSVYGVDMDVSRAYDTVPFELVRASLRRVRMPERMTKLVLDYLEQATATVRVHGKMYAEHTFDINAGVPQGSAIAPILFNIALDAMVSQLADRFDTVSAESPHSDTMLIVYADDVRLMATSTPQKVADMVSAAGSWLTTVDMTFSTTAGKNVTWRSQRCRRRPTRCRRATRRSSPSTSPDPTARPRTGRTWRRTTTDDATTRPAA